MVIRTYITTYGPISYYYRVFGIRTGVATPYLFALVSFRTLSVLHPWLRTQWYTL